MCFDGESRPILYSNLFKMAGHGTWVYIYIYFFFLIVSFFLVFLIEVWAFSRWLWVAMTSWAVCVVFLV